MILHERKALTLSAETSLESFKAMQDNFAAERQLNADQMRAFKLITQIAWTEINRDKAEAKMDTQQRLEHRKLQQLFLLILGGGGAGKTHLIRAIQGFFAALQMQHRMRTAAFTGNAARLIGGRTLHALLKLDTRRAASGKASSRALQKLKAVWQPVWLLLFDEVSMIGLKLFGSLSRRLTEITGADDSLPFGGLHIVLLGDFYQAPPVADIALYRRQLRAQVVDLVKAAKGIYNQLSKVIFFDK